MFLAPIQRYKVRVWGDRSVRALAEISRKELLLIGIVLFLFLGLNFSTATRFPVPWLDEVQFVDPAAKLYLRNSFSKSVYGWDRGMALHAHDPLYSLLLAGWFHLIGFGLAKARAFNYVLVLGTALILWMAVRRTNLVSSATYRVFLILLLVFGYSVSFPYRAGRIEPLFIFLASVLLLFSTANKRHCRIVLLASWSLLFAPAGLQLVAFTGVITFCLLIYLKQQILMEVMAIWAALLISVVGLFAFYAINGMWENVNVLFAPETVSGGVGAFLLEDGFTHQNRLPKDPSLMVLWGLLGFLIVNQMKHGGFQQRKVLTFSLLISVGLPLGLLVLAKFPTYYSWMVYVPLSVCLCSVIPQLGFRRPLNRWLQAILVLACLAGLPFQLLAVSYDWHDRDHHAVEKIVSAYVGKHDWVLCDYQAYFAAKAEADEVFLPRYLKRMSPREKGRVTILIGPSPTVTIWRSILGGEWELVSHGIEPARASILEQMTGKELDVGLLGKKYNFQIYKKVG